MKFEKDYRNENLKGYTRSVCKKPLEKRLLALENTMIRMAMRLEMEELASDELIGVAQAAAHELESIRKKFERDNL